MRYARIPAADAFRFPTGAAGALALGLLAFIQVSASARIWTRAEFAPTQSIATGGTPLPRHDSLGNPRSARGAVITPMPDLFGSILTTR